MIKFISALGVMLIMILQGCAGVNTFPTVARAGDTVSAMIGGSENARKETTLVTLTDINETEWDLQALGLVRSVFNLRADGRAEGTHYSRYIDSYFSWFNGHEPVQTVLVVDIPANVPAGSAYLTVDPAKNDDSSGIAAPYKINLEIIPGVGVDDSFWRKSLTLDLALDFTKLEPAPHAKISFGIDDGIEIGAASLVIDFDQTVLNPDDINIYVPESTVRGSVSNTGAFGKTQRMVYWRQNGDQLFIDVVAPQGVDHTYLKIYVLHPRGLSSSPNLTLLSSTIYDVNGSEIVLTPIMEYFQ
ncbi:MAG: hypothetical protein OQL06_11230 [Gammaproteobacteria bacterium]|nr:hypothetical protein [Gammaproteobacteria bacterium]